MASIINSLGDAFTHTIIALNGRQDAANHLGTGVSIDFLQAPPGRGSVLYPLAMRRIVLSKRPDLLVTYNWGAIDAVLGCAVAPPCAIVHNECGFGPDEATHLKARRVWVRRVALRHVFCTIVVSKLLLELARSRFSLPQHKVRFIQTGVDTCRFTPGMNLNLRREWGLDEGTLVFGFAGGLRGEKNLHLLLSAFKESGVADTSHLVLVGDGPDRVDLEQLAARLGIARRVAFRGHAPDMAQVMPAFDVFVMSSRTEQTPNALLEAMACGLPIVATDVGDCRAIAGELAASFVVPSNDVGAYATALHRMAASEQLRRELGTLNRSRAVSEFSRARMVQEYREVYDAAVRTR